MAFSQILQKLELRKGKASPKVTGLVGGGWIHTQAACLLATPMREARLRA